jgi:methylated-DNA-protein-cysteine methyltransferase related protein
MASSRAQLVAEILWELKRADKVANFRLVAERAGFSAGANGRAMETCLKTIRRDWPHLQWWRAIPIRDDGLLEKDSEQVVKLQECGYAVEDAEGSEEHVVVSEIEAHTMSWEAPVEAPVGSPIDESLDDDDDESEENADSDDSRAEKQEVEGEE